MGKRFSPLPRVVRSAALPTGALANGRFQSRLRRSAIERLAGRPAVERPAATPTTKAVATPAD